MWQMYATPRLHYRANIEQTLSKRQANVEQTSSKHRAIIYVSWTSQLVEPALSCKSLLDVCSMSARCLLDRVKGYKCFPMFMAGIRCAMDATERRRR